MQPETTVQIRTLRRAADTLGGVGELAAELNSPEADVKRWIQGTDRTPQVAFLKALDIVARGPGRQP